MMILLYIRYEQSYDKWPPRLSRGPNTAPPLRGVFDNLRNSVTASRQVGRPPRRD
jgi:hypothetical protein